MSFVCPSIRTKMARKRDGDAMSIWDGKWDNSTMEQMKKTLQEIGISPESIEAIEQAENKDQAKEYTLLLLAMFDDRHEYMA